MPRARPLGPRADIAIAYLCIAAWQARMDDRLRWFRGPATSDIKYSQVRDRFDLDALRGPEATRRRTTDRSPSISRFRPRTSLSAFTPHPPSPVQDPRGDRLSHRNRAARPTSLMGSEPRFNPVTAIMHPTAELESTGCHAICLPESISEVTLIAEAHSQRGVRHRNALG